jgi:hypothetical protein
MIVKTPNKRILTIPDTHARTNWYGAIDKHFDSVDKVVFLGDYCDPYFLASYRHILGELNKIISLKKEYPDKVELLIGNHDIHYIDNSSRAERYDFHLYSRLHKIFMDNLSLFKMAYQDSNYLWTHAGVSVHWFNKYQDIFAEHYGLNDDDTNLGDVFNKMFRSPDEDILCEVGNIRMRKEYDENWTGGILWADKSETIDSYMPEYHQIVGHSQVQFVTRIGDKDSSITYCDTLGHQDL